jgi:prepilin-type N-terminal cleavage/methylation domain-containing protein
VCRDEQRCTRGFTLIELLVTTAVFGIATIFFMQTITVNHRAYMVVDDVTETQQIMRAASSLLERDVLHAGFMVPEASAVCGVDSANAPDVLYVSDADAIDPDDDTAIYTGPEIQGGAVNVSGSLTLTLDSLIVEPGAPARPAYDTDGDGTNDSDFQDGGGVIIVDTLDTSRGVACGRITDVDLISDRITITVVSGGLTGTPALADLVAVPAHEYRISGSSQLLRDGDVLAEGVEDLQVAYFFDVNGNNVVDPGEYRGDGVGANYAANAVDGSDVREVRVNVVVRTHMEDAEFPSGRPQTTENRAAINTPDGFRRRVFTSTSMLRNVGNRLEGSL